MMILCHVEVQSKYGYTKPKPRTLRAGFEFPRTRFPAVYPKPGSVGVGGGVPVEVGVTIAGVGVFVRVGVLVGMGVLLGIGVLVGVDVGGGQGTLRELVRSQVPQFGKVNVRFARNRPAIGCPFKLKSASQYRFSPCARGIDGAFRDTGELVESPP